MNSILNFKVKLNLSLGWDNSHTWGWKNSSTFASSYPVPLVFEFSHISMCWILWRQAISDPFSFWAPCLNVTYTVAKNVVKWVRWYLFLAHKKPSILSQIDRMGKSYRQTGYKLKLCGNWSAIFIKMLLTGLAGEDRTQKSMLLCIFLWI